MGHKVGVPLSEETKRKISESVKKHPSTGHLHTQETKDLLRQKATDQDHSYKRSHHRGLPTLGFYDDQGYFYLSGLHGHPLAASNGAVQEARVVLYEKIGPGEHPCHWCGGMLEWGGLEGICSDHLDGDRLNNTPENVVPSCSPCNARRATLGNPVVWVPVERVKR